MATEMSKQEMVDTLQAERARWDQLVAEVGPERMEQPGVTGEWSVKDIIGHLMTWESRPVAWFRGARAGTRPQPPEWDTHLTEDQINAWIVQANRARPLEELVAESRRNFTELLEAVRAMPEQELASHDRFSWLKGRSLLESVGGNTYEHYQEHGDAIRAWLARQPQ